MAKHLFTIKKMTLVAILFLLPVLSHAQQKFNSNELDTLVATIALYPDPLLAMVLTASTYSDQLPGANAWAQAHSNLTGQALAERMELEDLPYDHAVQALIPFPSVLKTMATYRTWCEQLGDAVALQKDDVMDAVQRMRNRAYELGNLSSNEQVKVTTGDNIVIVPTRTEYVYVPVYDPHVVYYVRASGPRYIYYGHGVWLGSWYGTWGWGTTYFDWGPRLIYVRGHKPPPPRQHRVGGHNPPPPPAPSKNPPKKQVIYKEQTRIVPQQPVQVNTAPQQTVPQQPAQQQKAEPFAKRASNSSNWAPPSPPSNSKASSRTGSHSNGNSGSSWDWDNGSRGGSSNRGGSSRGGAASKRIGR